MFLKYIDIHGFKSFPDKTRINLEKGVTAIVGPNGSGKSNISDAIRWVLGEQSTKSLRGGKMEDIIFGGTQLRKPMGYAQVSLVLDNTDKRLPDMGDEINIGRRYYRSGDSDYLINGAAVRLKDIKEAFLDTGLSRDGYSIIGQGKISEIVGAKSTERREIFEEASGIAKYRYRKNEAENKLNAAEDNISRLRDILDELESRVGPLKQQSETALQFLELSEQRKKLEITLYCDNIERSRQAVKQQDEKIEIAKQDYTNVENSINDIDEKLELVFEQNRELAFSAEKSNNEIHNINERITELEKAVTLVESDMSYGEKQISDMLSQIETASDTAGGIEGEIIEREAMSVAIELVLNELDQKISAVESELSSLVNEGEISDQKRQKISSEMTVLSSSISDCQVLIATNVSEIDSLKKRDSELKEQHPGMVSKLEQIESEREIFTKEFADIESELTDCQNKKNGLSSKLEMRKAKLVETEQQLQKQNSLFEQLTHKIHLLDEMEKSMEGFAYSVKRVVEEGRNRNLRGVVGTVASLITIESGYEVAIETALGASMQHIVVSDETAAKDAITYLKQNKQGRATFLPLDTIKSSNFYFDNNLKQNGAIGTADSLVNCDEKYKDIISSLLGRIIIAEDLNSASSIAKKCQYKNRIVTTDGQVINAGGSYTGGSTSKSTGVFSRRNEIEQLKKDKIQASEKAKQLKIDFDKINNETVSIEAELTVYTSELINLGGDKIRVETELKRVELEHFAATSNLETAKNSFEQFAKEIEVKTEETKQHQNLLETTTEQLRLLETSFEDESSWAEQFNARRNDITERLSGARIERIEKQKDLEKISEVVEQLRERSRLEKDKSGDIAQTIELIKSQNAERAIDASNKRNEIIELSEKIEKIKQSISEYSNKRQEIEKATVESRELQSDYTRKREELAREVSRLEERKISMQKELDSSFSKLWEDYELTPKDAASHIVEYENITSLRQDVSGVRSKIKALGPVNVNAIEEYKEVKERYEFLSEQVVDVEKSRAELISLIESLTGEMQTIFSQSFEQINANFKKVFVEMFGGGSGVLSLTDEENILESGIEINVQPPGKVIKNLASLSGGEQSLVAIAIYFAILAVNPAPFCVLDEIDSALDDVNVARYSSYLRRITGSTQFVTITHRRGTMEASDTLYGVTMQEDGVSKLLKLTHDEAFLVATK